MIIWRISVCALVLVVGTTSNLRGYTLTFDLAWADSEEDHLAREVDDPTAILTQLQFHGQYTPRNFQTSAQTNTIQLRPIIPVCGELLILGKISNSPHAAGGNVTGICRYATATSLPSPN